MLENDAKGWYGSYSLVGRRSAEQYNNIIHKDEILKGENKKVKIPDMFAPDEMKHNHVENKLDFYHIYSLDANNLKKKIKQKYSNEEENKDKKDSKKFSLFYHNKHCSGENKKEEITMNEPGCTRYSPNYNYIWPKLITGIKWCDQRGRKVKKVEIDNRDFIINNLENYDKYVINSGFVKCFVNMNNLKKKKNLLKKSIKINKTIKEKPNINGSFNPIQESFNNDNIKNIAKTSNNFYHPKTSSDFAILKTYDTNIKYKKNFSNNNFTGENFSFNVSKEITPEFSMNFPGKTQKNFFSESKIIKNGKKNKTLYIELLPEEDNISKIYPSKSSGKVPDFSKYSSREKKVKKYRVDNLPYVSPKYSFVEERSLTMAVYKKARKIKKYKQVPFQGMIMGLDYDPDKVIEKYNNHQSPKVPNFKNMTSRPNKKGSPLPSFLQKVYDRSAPYLTTDKSLKLNNFSEGKYIPASNSFFPKKSYNKIVNLKMANSKAFLQKSLDEDIQKKKNEVTEKLKLEKVNLEELKVEGALNKFDNFCYKTILRKKPIHAYKKLLMSFECEEKEEGEE